MHISKTFVIIQPNIINQNEHLTFTENNRNILSNITNAEVCTYVQKFITPTRKSVERLQVRYEGSLCLKLIHTTAAPRYVFTSFLSQKIYTFCELFTFFQNSERNRRAQLVIYVNAVCIQYENSFYITKSQSRLQSISSRSGEFRCEMH